MYNWKSFRYMYIKVFPHHRPPACPFQFYPLSPALETPLNHFLITFWLIPLFQPRCPQYFCEKTINVLDLQCNIRPNTVYSDKTSCFIHWLLAIALSNCTLDLVNTLESACSKYKKQWDAKITKVYQITAIIKFVVQEHGEIHEHAALYNFSNLLDLQLQCARFTNRKYLKGQRNLFSGALHVGHFIPFFI